MASSTKRRPNTPQNSRSNTLQALERGLDVLDLLSRGQQLGPTNLARHLRVDRATVHRILRTLMSRSFVTKGPDAHYHVNLQHFLELVERLTSRGEKNWLTLAESCLEELRSATGLSANFCMPSGMEMVYMMRVIGTSSLAVNSPPGSRRPLHTTGVGKAYLGGLPEEELNTLLAKLDLHTRTPNSITSLMALKADIRKGRARGYYVDEQETDARIRCLASPVRDALARPIACIGVSGPADGPIFEDIEKLGSLVVEKAKLISRAIGYTITIGTLKPQGFTTGVSESPRNTPARLIK